MVPNNKWKKKPPEERENPRKVNTQRRGGVSGKRLNCQKDSPNKKENSKSKGERGVSANKRQRRERHRVKWP